jgi:hypothetical protein
MGSRKIPEPREIGKKNLPKLDDSGQLSIDFYIGLSIFLIALIFAGTMISGLLVGLQSKKIDFDAVAYRTGVILVEDPGEPNTQFNYLTITEADQWEFIGYDQKDQVRRFGLTLYKSTPRILPEQKIASFHNRSRFPADSEYRERIIFGSIPYRFNITLKVLGDNGPPSSVGDKYNPNSAYGYIRRVVLVKNQSSAVVNLSNPKYYNNTTPGDGKFYVDLNYTALLDRDKAPHYWIEPPKEQIIVNLTNVQGIRNQSLNPGENISLNQIRIRYVGELYDGSIQEDFLPIDVSAIIDSNPVTFAYGVTSVTPVNSTINITFPAGYFIPPSAYANITLIKMKIFYDFNQSTVNISQGNNTYYYLPGSEGFSQPYLNPAIMEVRVW